MVINSDPHLSDSDTHPLRTPASVHASFDSLNDIYEMPMELSNKQLSFREVFFLSIKQAPIVVIQMNERSSLVRACQAAVPDSLRIQFFVLCSQ